MEAEASATPSGSSGPTGQDAAAATPPSPSPAAAATTTAATTTGSSDSNTSTVATSRPRFLPQVQAKGGKLMYAIGASITDVFGNMMGYTAAHVYVAVSCWLLAAAFLSPQSLRDLCCCWLFVAGLCFHVLGTRAPSVPSKTRPSLSSTSNCVACTNITLHVPSPRHPSPLPPPASRTQTWTTRSSSTLHSCTKPVARPGCAP